MVTRNRITENNEELYPAVDLNTLKFAPNPQ